MVCARPGLPNPTPSRIQWAEFGGSVLGRPAAQWVPLPLRRSSRYPPRRSLRQHPIREHPLPAQSPQIGLVVLQLDPRQPVPAHLAHWARWYRVRVTARSARIRPVLRHLKRRALPFPAPSILVSFRDSRDHGPVGETEHPHDSPILPATPPAHDAPVHAQPVHMIPRFSPIDGGSCRPARCTYILRREMGERCG